MTSKKEALNNPDVSEPKEFSIVGIGASAGGLDPIRKLLEHLPANIGLSFVIIQHLIAGQESMLPEILSRSTQLKVLQVTDNLKVELNNVYVIPPGTTITLKDGYLKLAARVQETIAKPINVFFTTLALEKKTHAIGVVLSGTGNDGTEGLKAIKAEGGITFAQDQKTAQYSDMPQNAIDAQAVDFVLSPQQIAKELVNIAKNPQLTHDLAKAQETMQAKSEVSLKKILAMLKSSYGIDFTHYKESTVNRRITRRMVINNAKNITAYIEYLRSTPNERKALFDDLLIGVTSFFREPQTFTALKEKVLPELVKNRSLNQPMRIWVLGCSTGEEVYSIAIAIQEFLEENDIFDIQIQIFGTDANGKAIEKARQGIYPKTIEDNVSENRLKRFFTKNNGNYQIIKPIRDMCVFAKHDITVDPPFSNLDIIMCRNVLIYFDGFLHEKVLPTLHYGLKPDGFLVLGESESVGKFNYLFEQLSSKSAVFKKKRVQLQPTFRAEPFAPFAAKKAVKPAEKIDQQNLLKKEFDHLLLEQYIPAALLVNSNLDVLFFRGQVNPYLTHDPGTASLNVSKLICKELRSQVQSAIYRVRKDNKVYNEIVRLEQKEQQKAIEVHVEPLKVSEYDELFYTISFKEVNYPVYLSSQTTPANASAEIESIKDRQIVELKEDLESTKQSLETIIEAHEATNEELRSAMEESQSSNEELQSTNEELETAKEELQSSNEELQTLNEELKNRNQELSRINDDLTNLITNIDTTVIIVDDNFKIRRFSAAAQEVLRITPTDVGRLITDILISIQIKDLETMLQDVTSNLVSVRREVAGGNGRFYELRVKPYLTSEKKIDGAILIFVDITERKLLENERSRHTGDLEFQLTEQALKLVQSERLANIGETAGMVGHDLRNPLQAITGEVYLAKSELKALPEGEQKTNLQENMAAIEEQTRYMDKIVSDLQTFFKPVEAHKQTVKLKQLIDRVLAKVNIPKNIQISLQVDEELTANADSQLLKRVLINLATNAVQAMPKGGKLTIKAHAGEKEQVQIIVEDTGVGIPEEIKPKLFTPLFTTKSKGQGFGLAVCKRVIEAQDGTIDFESQEGKGTKFTVSLPAQKAKENT